MNYGCMINSLDIKNNYGPWAVAAELSVRNHSYNKNLSINKQNQIGSHYYELYTHTQLIILVNQNSKKKLIRKKIDELLKSKSNTIFVCVRLFMFNVFSDRLIYFNFIISTLILFSSLT